MLVDSDLIIQYVEFTEELVEKMDFVNQPTREELLHQVSEELYSSINYYLEDTDEYWDLEDEEGPYKDWCLHSREDLIEDIKTQLQTNLNHYFEEVQELIMEQFDKDLFQKNESIRRQVREENQNKVYNYISQKNNQQILK